MAEPLYHPTGGTTTVAREAGGMSRLFALLLLLLSVSGPAVAADQTPVPPSKPTGPPSIAAPTREIQLTPAARVQHKPLDEMSGIVPSRRYPGVYWVHNDSGAGPDLYAIQADGTVVAPPGTKRWIGTPVPDRKPFTGIEILQASNVDWEDIASDGDTLYILDTGNNANARRDLGVYLLPEPNPRVVTKTRALAWLPVAYADQDEFPGIRHDFDCEAGFVWKGRLYFLTKHRVGEIPAPGTRLLRLDTRFADRVNVLTPVDAQKDLGGWVTAADASPDGARIAVLCQAPIASVWLFEAPPKGDRLLSGTARRLILGGAGQCEAICFADAETLLITNEDGEIFRVPLSEFPTGP